MPRRRPSRIAPRPPPAGRRVPGAVVQRLSRLRWVESLTTELPDNLCPLYAPHLLKLSLTLPRCVSLLPPRTGVTPSLVGDAISLFHPPAVRTLDVVTVAWGRALTLSAPRTPPNTGVHVGLTLPAGLEGDWSGWTAFTQGCRSVRLTVEPGLVDERWWLTVIGAFSGPHLDLFTLDCPVCIVSTDDVVGWMLDWRTRGAPRRCHLDLRGTALGDDALALLIAGWPTGVLPRADAGSRPRRVPGMPGVGAAHVPRAVRCPAASPRGPVLPSWSALGGCVREALEVRVDIATILGAIPPIGWAAVSPTSWIACDRPGCCIVGHA